MTTATISVSRLSVECLIGCLAEERQVPQKISVEIELTLEAPPVARSEELSATLDYVDIAEQAAFILRAGRFQLLEAASLALLRHFLHAAGGEGRHAQALSGRVALTKFNALAGEARARVEMAARGDDFSYANEAREWGTVDVVSEWGGGGLYRLNIKPGRKLPNHYHLQMRESEMVLDAGLEGWRDDQPPVALRAGDVFEWPMGVRHGYRNVGSQSAAILCLDSPSFDPKDEIVAPGGP